MKNAVKPDRNRPPIKADGDIVGLACFDGLFDLDEVVFFVHRHFEVQFTFVQINPHIPVI